MGCHSAFPPRSIHAALIVVYRICARRTVEHCLKASPCRTTYWKGYLFSIVTQESPTDTPPPTRRKGLQHEASSCTEHEASRSSSRGSFFLERTVEGRRPCLFNATRSQCLCRTGHRDSVAARSDLGRWRLLASTGRRHRGRHAGRTRARVDDSNTASGSLVAVPRDRRRFLYCQSSEAVPPRFVSMLNDTPQCAWLTTHRWLMTVVQPLRVVLGHRVLTARLSLCRFYEVLVLTGCRHRPQDSTIFGSSLQASLGAYSASPTSFRGAIDGGQYSTRCMEMLTRGRGLALSKGCRRG